ncbi:MAG: hypothetical protein IJR98_02850 [Synergistaceae bacterium]|nr:hypothetical protein [Synergistaceae bacterium]
MKKLFFALVLLCIMCSESHAVSEDMSVYVRQDVFDAKMEMLFLRLHGEIENLGTRIEALSARIDALDKKIDGVDRSLSEKIDGVNRSLSEKIDGVNRSLSARIDGVDKRIEDTHTFVYWILVLFGAIFLMPFVNKFWEFYRERRTPALTVEDVQRIVNEAIRQRS